MRVRGCEDEGVEGVLPRPHDQWWAERSAAGLGVYVHVPFCAHRCGYCDFATFAGLEGLAEGYVQRVCAEIAERVPGPAATVFVGGGTPSVLAPDLLGRLLGAVPKEAGAECTVEMNPESASAGVLAAVREAGANRVSFGMQSAAPHVLAFLERRHSPGRVAAAVTDARTAGFEEVNLDLVCGTPGESGPDWDATLDVALALGPTHLSVYALTVEDATPLGRAVATGERPAPDEDAAADRLAVAARRLREAGYARYEISNWARHKPCLHNLRYWSGGAYVGVGAAAHSYDPGVPERRWNHRHPRTYMEAADPVAGSEVLDGPTRETEALWLGLRRACGVPAPDHVPGHLLEGGLCTLDAGRLRLTERGMAVADGVVRELSLARGCHSRRVSANFST